MPSRVIREELLTSRSMSRVSEGAQLLFVKLILACDDYGRFHGEPEILKGRLFPLNEISVETVAERLSELHSEGCISLYNGDSGRTFVLLTGWERHRGKSKRASESKFPDSESCKEQSTASPEIREIREIRPWVWGMESGVWGMDRSVADAGAPDISPGKPPEPQPKRRGKPKDPELPPPQPWPDAALARLRAHAEKLGIAEPRHAVVFALEALADRFEAGSTPNAAKLHTARGWEAVARKGLREGWLLTGFDPSKAKARQRAEFREAMEARAAREPPMRTAEDLSEQEREDLRAMGVGL